MILKHLHIFNYRNIAGAELDFSSNVNCFVGQNGMGKSNVLDAVYYLAFCRGFAASADAVNLLHGADAFMLEGRFELENGALRKVCCSLKKGSRKRLRVDGKDVKRLSQYVGQVPLVYIAPTDASLLTGGSEERRRFMDTALMQHDAAYLEALIRYERALKQRNVLLRQDNEPDAAVLDALESMMSVAADIIYARRAAFVEAFLPIFKSLYAMLSGREQENVAMTYVSHGDRGTLQPLLRGWRVKEHIIGFTLHGPHKDDLELTLNGYGVKKEASQGQQKTFFIAMKLAQYLYLKRQGEQRVPLLLLDDIFDKLDDSRVERIIHYVGGNDFGQIFITDTQRAHLDRILAATSRPYRLFEVKTGEIRRVDSLTGDDGEIYQGASDGTQEG